MKETKKLIKKKIIMKGEKVSSEILYNRDGFMISEKIYDDNGEIIRSNRFFNNEKIEFSKVNEMEYITGHQKRMKRYPDPLFCYSKAFGDDCFILELDTYFKEDGSFVINDYLSDTITSLKYNKITGEQEKVVMTNMTTKNITYDMERFFDEKNRVSSVITVIGDRKRKNNVISVLEEMTYFDDGKIKVNEYKYDHLTKEKGEKISTTIFDKYWNELNRYNTDGSYSIYHYDCLEGKDLIPTMEEYDDRVVIRKSFDYGENIKVESLHVIGKNKHETISNTIEIQYKEKDIINNVYIDMVHNYIEHTCEHDITEIIEYYD